jgi:hypothetical protein
MYTQLNILFVGSRAQIAFMYKNSQDVHCVLSSACVTVARFAMRTGMSVTYARALGGRETAPRESFADMNFYACVLTVTNHKL